MPLAIQNKENIVTSKIIIIGKPFFTTKFSVQVALLLTYRINGTRKETLFERQKDQIIKS